MNDPFTLTGKDILVTGATSQIGEAIAHAIVAAGGRVFLTGRNEAKLQGVAVKISSSVLGVSCLDYTAETEVQAFVQDAPAFHGLMFAGGLVPSFTPFRMAGGKHIDEVMRANFFGPASLLQELLKKRKLQENSSCVFISSVAAGGSPEATAYYSAAKAGLLSLLRSVGSEYAKRGIRLNSVAYGYLQGSTIERLGVSQERLDFAPLGVPSPAEVTGAPLFLLSDASRWITRKTLVVDGGVNLKQHWVI